MYDAGGERKVGTIWKNTPIAMTHLHPNLAPNSPPITCVSTYPQKNELLIIPRMSLSQ